MLIGTARGVRLAGVLAGGAAVVSMGVVGCTTVTGGGATADVAEAPAYRTSVSLSSSQSAASSSARESEREAAMTTRAVQTTCETLSTTSASAINAVNSYVDAFNDAGGDTASAKAPAVDSLNQSADAVATSIAEIVPVELRDAFLAWVEGAYATADAITNQAGPEAFNQIIDDLNNARSEALRLCDATY